MGPTRKSGDDRGNSADGNRPGVTQHFRSKIFRKSKILARSAIFGSRLVHAARPLGKVMLPVGPRGHGEDIGHLTSDPPPIPLRDMAPRTPNSNFKNETTTPPPQKSRGSGMRTSAISARTCCGYPEVQTYPTSSSVYAMWALFLGQEQP